MFESAIDLKTVITILVAIALIGQFVFVVNFLHSLFRGQRVNVP
jgi:hypothetical protein